jgi:hypothetical protein
MRRILLFALLLLPLGVCAQPIEMLGEDAFWSYKGRVCIEESKSPVFLSDFWSSYQLSGYEEINGQMYHSLFRSLAFVDGKRFQSPSKENEETDMAYLMGIRENDGRIFVDAEENNSVYGSENVVYEKLGTEYLIYDFTLNVGDTFGTNGTIVDWVDEVVTDDGVSRKLFVLSSGHEILEGIGCLYSMGELVNYLSEPVLQSNIYDGFNYTYLSDFSEGEKLVYTNSKDAADQYVMTVRPISGKSSSADSSLYDLSGRKLPSLQGGVGGRLHKGVYIQNGKKIVVK